MKVSKLFSLNLKDLLKGLIVAVLAPAIVIIQQSLDEGVLVFDWKQILMASLAGAGAYLLKNFLSNSAGKFLSSEESIVGGHPSTHPPRK